jgi:signal transduction histidine kinase
MRQSSSNALARSATNGEHARNDTSIGALQERIETLEKENQELRQHAEYRSQFLSRLAHELRTPLTSILGFSEILLGQEQLTKTQRGFCERIQNSAQQLQLTLNQLADLARLQSGRSELSREEFSLAELLREACAALGRQAKKQNVQLSYDAQQSLPPIISDRIKLGQVVFNFLGFAIARSPEAAPVTIAAIKTAGGFAITITDEGERLIEPNRFELDLTHNRSGCSEIGLAVAKQNLNLLGAVLTIENRGRSPGLIISISLPDAAPNTQ